MPQHRPDLTGPIHADTPSFYWSNVRCRHCSRLPDNLDAVVNTARMMQRIRAILGNKPIFTSSWFRCSVHNGNVGGASDSQHLQGRAVDFSTKHLSPRQVAQRLRKLVGEDKLIGGLGSYAGFCHADNRPSGRGAYWRK